MRLPGLCWHRRLPGLRLRPVPPAGYRSVRRVLQFLWLHKGFSPTIVRTRLAAFGFCPLGCEGHRRASEEADVLFLEVRSRDLHLFAGCSCIGSCDLTALRSCNLCLLANDAFLLHIAVITRPDRRQGCGSGARPEHLPSLVTKARGNGAALGRPAGPASN